MEAAWQDNSWGVYHGPHCQRVESMLGEMHAVEHARLCSSGTFAVELALRALKIGPDDEVILAGYDFSANFRSIEAVGARPVLVDISPNNWCLDTETIESGISDATRAVIVSHLHGGMAPMQQIRELCDRNGVSIVEDACQSQGAVVDGRAAGSWGDVGVLSFGGSKLITAGRGGAILTGDAEIAQRARIFCERGNNAFPMSELQAVVLPPQLEKLPQRNAIRSKSVARLHSQLKDVTHLRPTSGNPPKSEPSYFKVPWMLETDHLTREAFICGIQSAGVGIDEGFRGFTRRSERRCRKVGPLTNSAIAAESTVVLHHPVLLEPSDTLDLVAATIRTVTRPI